MRMRECFYTVFLPGRSLAPATLVGYLHSLALWERLAGDPPIELLGGVGRDKDGQDAAKRADARVVAFNRAVLDDPDAESDQAGQRKLAFERPIRQKLIWGGYDRRGLLCLRPRGIWTADKHLRWLRAVLKAAAREGLIARVPVMPFNGSGKPDPRPIPDALLSAIYAACEVALQPLVRGVWPAHWWRALLCVAVCCGTRREALLGLRWEQLDLAGATLTECGEFDKVKRAHRKPLPPAAVAHLMRVRSDLAGPFVSLAHSRRFDRQWLTIQRAAGIDKESHFRFHCTKHTCGTAWGRQSSDLSAVSAQLGHSQLETSRFYVEASGKQREVADRFELPACFTEDFPSLQRKQG
jgi:integrase